MVDQATVKGNAAQESRDGHGVKINAPAESVVGSLAEFTHDITTLVELQVKLAAMDAKESIGRAMVPAILVGVGVVLLLGSLPVALFGVAELLVAAGMTHGSALLLTGGVGIVGAGLLAVVAGLALSRSFTSFRRSREELARNIAWVKTVILYSGRAVSQRRR